MATDGEGELDPLSLAEQVGLAVRAWRRREGLSQRELAEFTGWSQSMISRLETRAGGLPLDTVQKAVAGIGCELLVAHRGQPVGTDEWVPTDLVARDRAGRRFPAHRRVHHSAVGPSWWWEQEFIRLSRPLGPRPRWTTEGFELLRRLGLEQPDDG